MNNPLSVVAKIATMINASVVVAINFSFFDSTNKPYWVVGKRPTMNKLSSVESTLRINPFV